MSDLIKAQNTPQFNWYTSWMSLGANGMPDKLIKEGMKQPDWIKIFFKKNSKDSTSKEITGHVAPNQAQFGAEYFLAYTLPNYKSKILTWLLDAQKDNGPLLFNLMGQRFQGVGLTEWTSVIMKWCPNDADRTKANFNECIRDYLEAIARFLNIDNQLIFWLCTSKKLALMPMHQFTWHQASFSATLMVVTSIEQWTYLQHKRRVNKSSSCSPRCTRTSSPTWTSVIGHGLMAGNIAR